MLVIPSIRVQGGACIGDLPESGAPDALADREPSSWARWLERCGAPALHVVDCDGEAAAGQMQFLDLIDVLMAVGIPVQISAGLQRRDDIAQVLSRGAARVTIDADRMPGADLEHLLDDFGDRLVPSLACTDEPRGRETACASLAALQRLGAARVLCSVPARAGTMAGVALDLYTDLAAMGLPLIASGGVGSLGDVSDLAGLPGVEAVIVDRAVREGRFTLPAAQIAADVGAREGR